MSDSKKDPNRDMPPVPRDHDKASYSELIPLKSKSINVLKSPLFYMVVLTAFASIWMLGYRRNLIVEKNEKGECIKKLANGECMELIDLETLLSLVNLAVAYMLALVLLVVYLYSRSDRPFWHFLVNFAFVSAIIWVPGLLEIYAIPFRDFTGSEKLIRNDSVLVHWVGMFMAAGLMEELIKITLVMIGAYFTFNAVRGKNSLPESILDIIRIRGPLDGLMMGLFGGAGFILLETGAGTEGSGYVFRVMGLSGTLAKYTMAPLTGDSAWGLAQGLMLLFPRVMGGMVRHMAWAGIIGYFIGLSVIRPKQALKLLLMAWVGVSALHATWNTGSYVSALWYLSALVSGMFVIACFLKARQLDMSQRRSVDSYGSIVVNPARRAQAAPTSPAKVGQAQQPAQAPPSPQPAPQPAAAAASISTTALGLAISGTVIPVEQGKMLNLGSIAELGGRGAGIVGEVTRHPTRENVLGLKNLGAEPWTAHLRDGTEQPIETQRNIRLAPGVKIDFGHGLRAEVVVT